ncbi:uncharacterized protein [Diadema antillarum]|uniref:uncharacterized protein n=1 Tax=Diadema antillarum TaxID=105358 RepID=UPI003A87F89F
MFEYNMDGHYALLRAVSSGRPRQVRLLLESGIGVHHTDACGQTPLIRAMFIENSRHRHKIVRLLLRRGALVSHQDYVGRSSLAWACLRGLDDVFEQLMKHGDGELDLNDTDMNDCTPLFHAATSGSAAMVKLLVEYLQKYGLSIDVPNKDGITPLMQAIRLGNDVCASILLNQGKASVTVRDKNHRSALDWAEATTRQGQIRTNFLPQIKQSNRKSQSGRRPARLYAYCGSDSDSDDIFSVGSVDRRNVDLDGGEGSEFSDVKSTCSSSYSSQTSGSSSSCDSSPEVFRRVFRGFPTTGEGRPEVLSSARQEHCDQSSQPVSNSPSAPGQDQIKEYNDLPEIFRLFSGQLTDTFRRGVTRQQNSLPEHPSSPEHTDCQMECCVPQGGVKLSDEALQRMVLANIKAKDGSNSSRLDSTRSNSASSKRSTQSSRLPSLRRQLTRKRFIEANSRPDGNNDDLSKRDVDPGNSAHSPRSNPDSSVAQSDDMGSAASISSNFPAIVQGKTSLVSADGGAEKSSGALKKDIERILSSNVHHLSL